MVDIPSLPCSRIKYLIRCHSWGEGGGGLRELYTVFLIKELPSFDLKIKNKLRTITGLTSWSVNLKILFNPCAQIETYAQVHTVSRIYRHTAGWNNNKHVFLSAFLVFRATTFPIAISFFLKQPKAVCSYVLHTCTILYDVTFSLEVVLTVSRFYRISLDETTTNAYFLAPFYCFGQLIHWNIRN